jgi:hypothetical protein
MENDTSGSWVLASAPGLQSARLPIEGLAQNGLLEYPDGL